MAIITVATQYVIQDNTTEELHACQAEYEELERKYKELEEELHTCEQQNEKCRKLVLILAASGVLANDDLDDY